MFDLGSISPRFTTFTTLAAVQEGVTKWAGRVHNQGIPEPSAAYSWAFRLSSGCVRRTISSCSLGIPLVFEQSGRTVRPIPGGFSPASSRRDHFQVPCPLQLVEGPLDAGFGAAQCFCYLAPRPFPYASLCPGCNMVEHLFAHLDICSSISFVTSLFQNFFTLS